MQRMEKLGLNFVKIGEWKKVGKNKIKFKRNFDESNAEEIRKIIDNKEEKKGVLYAFVAKGKDSSLVLKYIGTTRQAPARKRFLKHCKEKK